MSHIEMAHFRLPFATSVNRGLVPLRLGVREMAEIKQVFICMVSAPIDSTRYNFVLSLNPDDEDDYTELTRQNQPNIIVQAVYHAQGNLFSASWLFPLPGRGVTTGGDVMFIEAESAGGQVGALCSIWYERRKAKAGERELLFRSRR